MMQVKLYTSLTGLYNRLNGKKMAAFTANSSMSNPIDDIDIIVDFDEIEEIHDNGMIIIKEKQN